MYPNLRICIGKSGGRLPKNQSNNIIMLISAQDSLEVVFQRVTSELMRGPSEKDHPFRLVPVSTQSAKTIDSRYVVLREVDDSLKLYFYSDARTDKIRDLRSSERIALLFYHPGLQLQVRVNGVGVLHNQDELSRRHWKNIDDESRRAYTPHLAPGDSIERPSEAYSWPLHAHDRYFTVIKVIPKTIDILQLSGHEHIRALFTKKVDGWQKQWLAP